MPGEPSDEKLMRDLAAGDREALATLFRRHHPNIYALCVRMCGSPAAGEDVAQEVFLRVLRRAHTYDGEARLSTWLYRVARNACLDHLRTARRETAKLRRFAVEPDTRPCAPEGPRVAAIERLADALERLDPEKRAVLILRRYHELSLREIADVCGCTEGTARVRLHRALQTLRQIYEELERTQARADSGRSAEVEE